MPTYSHSAQLLLDVLPHTVLPPKVWSAAIVLAGALLQHWLQPKWMRRKQALLERRARDWPTITATIEVTVGGGYVSGKGLPLATLVYFYRNPALQMGEYKRPFPTKERAQVWVKQFKNRTVLVHVNPADPADSVPFSSEIGGAEPPASAMQEVAEASAATISDSLAPGDAIHALTPGMRVLCGAAEIISLSGFAVSAVLFAVSLTSRPNLQLSTFYWICGAMLSITILSTILVYLELNRSESGRQLLRTYRRWCPAWMRWSLTVTSVFFTVLHPLYTFLESVFGPNIHSVGKRFGPHLPYLLGCWVFFVLAAFMAAIMGSQEDPRSIIETVGA